MVEKAALTGRTPMTAALKYLSRKADEMFEAHMRRAAQKISERQKLFPAHAA
jgi:hypothetical protein